MSPREDVILIVEDDPDDRHLLARAFRKAQVQVPLRFANDGDEALLALGNASADADKPIWPVVILLDLKLPRRSGFEVLEWIKAHMTLRRVAERLGGSCGVLSAPGEGSRFWIDLPRWTEPGAGSPEV